MGETVKAAVVYQYARPFPGREAVALEAFGDALAFWGKEAANGRCLEPLTFLSNTGKGMVIIRGESEDLHEIIEVEEHRKLYAKAALAVPDITLEFFIMDDAVQEQLQIWAGVGSDLGLM